MTSSQQGLDLLAKCLVDPGDAVVVDRPCYLGAIQTFRAAGARLVGWDLRRGDRQQRRSGGCGRGRRWGRTLQGSLAYFLGGCFFMLALATDVAKDAAGLKSLAEGASMTGRSC